jgi:serralysin
LAGAPDEDAVAGPRSDCVTLQLQFKGFAYPSWWNGAYADPASSQSLDDMAQTHANAIELGGDYFVNTYQSNSIYADPVGTESLANLGTAIDQAHQHGLTVLVKPLVDSKDGTWRGQFQPSNPAAFFQSYKAMIVAEAEVAEAHHAEIFSVGCEMDQLTGSAYAGYWNDIIASVRSVYRGKLTYAAEWPDPGAVSFWSALDYAGVDNYMPLSRNPDPSVDELVAAWTHASSDPTVQQYFGTKSPIQFFEDFAASVGKPLLFTELGYGSNNLAAGDPADFWDPSSPDPALQAKLYQAFFAAWNSETASALKGVFLWDWNTYPDGPNAGDSGWATGYTPQGKPAEAVITEWFEAGSDIFRFDRPLTRQNIHQIPDYDPTIDGPIRLAHAIFRALPKGHLAAAHFVVGSPHNPHQLISYRAATGALVYDSNGSLPGHAVEFAILPAHLHLTHADFLVF